MDFISNPFNYVASKDRILGEVTSEFDYTKEFFVDAFCGSGVVSVNVGDKFKTVIMNDGCAQMVSLLAHMYSTKLEELMEEIKSYIERFHLSKDNKEGFLKAREAYNRGERDDMLLYMLITHAFSYNVVFNSRGGFSVPSGAGRSWFNPSLRRKFTKFCEAFQKLDNIGFTSFTLDELMQMCINGATEVSNYMFYFDPPYLTSDGSCSRSYGLRWTKEHDKKLMDFADYISEHGGSFAMSNALKNNGYVNEELAAWASNYNVVHIACDYNNCHHQRKNRGDTEEVVIKNF